MTAEDAPPKRRRMTDKLLREVADVYRVALSEKEAPTASVAKRYSVSHRTAGRYIREARERGFLGKAIGTRPGEGLIDEKPQKHDLNNEIASQIRRYRQAKNWSVRQLAEECARLGAPNLSASSLANIERGQDPDAKRPRRLVTVEELDIIQRALGVRLMELHLICHACGGTPPSGFSCLKCGAAVGSNHHS